MGFHPRRGEAEASPDSLLDARQAASFLCIALDTLYRWVQLGRVPVVRMGRTVRFRLRSLEEFVAEHEEGTSGETE